MTDVVGTQIGLNDKLFGAIGTIIMQFMPFNITGPPQDREYAVEPVGVEIKIPSHVVVVMNSLSIIISRMTLFSFNLVTAISFITNLVGSIVYVSLI